MAQKSPANTAWRSPERVVDLDRTRFLVLMDDLAPHVWEELAAEGPSVDINRWTLRHHLASWAIPYAIDRLERERASPRPGGGWLRLCRGRIQELDEAARSPPVYDPSTMRLSVFRRKVELYISRVQAAATRAGLAPVGAIEDRHLRWLIRRQVLGESAERIAETGLAGRFDAHAKELAAQAGRKVADADLERLNSRRQAALRVQAEVIREATKSVATRLGMALRRLRPGRRRKQGLPR